MREPSSEFERRCTFEISALLEDTLAEMLIDGFMVDDIALRRGYCSIEIFACNRLFATVSSEFVGQEFRIWRTMHEW